MILPSLSILNSSSLTDSIVVWIVISLSLAVKVSFFFFNSNLIPASTGIKFLVDIAFDTFDKASNIYSFLIVNLIYYSFFLIYIYIIAVEKVENSKIILFFNKNVFT